MEILKNAGERIKALREERGVTQKQMAEILDCTPSHYQKIEYGKVNISVTALYVLAEYFCVSTDYILGRTDNREVSR